jgi:endonuclease III
MTRLERILGGLETFYGKQSPIGPTDAYEMILYRNAGYPASDERCLKGFDTLKKDIGLEPREILEATEKNLVRAMRAGGMIPETRAKRLKQIALIVHRDYGGDLRAVLRRPVSESREILKGFPTIGDPGADRILLFTRTAAIAALPSNCLHLLLRLGYGRPQTGWAAAYREAQDAAAAELPEDSGVRQRAYLLLKRHGEDLCRRTRPACQGCPVSGECRYFQGLALPSAP